MLTRRHQDQSGSMPLVILASIVVLGLVTVLFTSAITSQRVTRFDQSFTQAFHGADAGMQAALAQIRTTDPNGLYAGADLVAPADAANGDVTYDYTATKVGNRWQVRAEGTTTQGDTRVLEATVLRPSRFFLAAFGKTLVGFKGANGADSYNGTAVDTGNGAVGTNGDIELNGNAHADLLFLYGPTAQCAKTTQNCEDMLPYTEEVGEPYVPDTEFMEDALAAEWCTDSITSYRASTDGELVGGAGPGPNGEYCFTSMTFDEHIDVDATAADVIVYTSGTVSSANHTIVNCPGCHTYSDPATMLANEPPDASTLQIYSTGPSVQLGNHSHIAAAVYAPNASCHGNPSNAQGYIYGSMLCNDINNQGGWSFWFDDRLADIGAKEWRISGIREESQSSTSF